MAQLATSVFLWAILISCYHVDSQEDESWSYRGDNGPASWGTTYPQCDGMAQSPVEIDTSMILLNMDLKNLRLSKCYAARQTFTLTNVGRGLKLEPGKEFVCSLAGNLVGNNYTLKEANFHWGTSANPQRGSEHIVDGVGYAMEVQLRHVHDDDVVQKNVIFSILFQLTENENSAALEPIIKALEKVGTKGMRTQGSGLVLQEFFKGLIPVVNLIHYTGSFTTPECTEGVDWYIFGGPEPISKRQLKAFQSLKGDGGEELGGNIRPVQPINDREIEIIETMIRTEGGLL